MTPDEAKIDQRKSRQAMRDLLEKREAADLANAERDAPIRERFHKYMESEGYDHMQTPAPGRCYNGATQQMLWECWLKATLDERPQWTLASTPPPMKVGDCGWPESVSVLVLNCGRQTIAYIRQIDDDSPAGWVDSGSEGWVLNSVTEWMPLPSAPGSTS